jgi:hypothetical protein
MPSGKTSWTTRSASSSTWSSRGASEGRPGPECVQADYVQFELTIIRITITVESSIQHRSAGRVQASPCTSASASELRIVRSVAPSTRARAPWVRFRCSCPSAAAAGDVSIPLARSFTITSTRNMAIARCTRPVDSPSLPWPKRLSPLSLRTRDRPVVIASRPRPTQYQSCIFEPQRPER